MYGPDRIYGFDIETDNSEGFGLVPEKSRVTEIAIDTASGGEVFAGNERTILRDFEAYLGTLEPGLLVPWNGAFFDVPFITDRWAAVNWMSDSVANDQSPAALPSTENSGSSRSGATGGLSISAELSISTLSKMTEPLPCCATLVSITWKEEMRTGNFVDAGNVHSRSFQPLRIAAPSGPDETPSAFR